MVGCARIAIALLSLGTVPTTASQRQAGLAEEVQAAYVSASYTECTDTYRQFRSRNQAGAIAARETASFILEGVRLFCETTRLSIEAARLGAERTRLLSSAEALDREWLRAHRADPAKFPDFAGRDRSQKQMRADAGKLENSRADLMRERARLLKLGESSISVAVQVDPDAANDLLERLLGARPRFIS